MTLYPLAGNIYQPIKLDILVTGTAVGFVLSSVMFVCCFYCFTSQVNSYGHDGTVSSPNHTFPGQA